MPKSLYMHPLSIQQCWSEHKESIYPFVHQPTKSSPVKYRVSTYLWRLLGKPGKTGTNNATYLLIFVAGFLEVERCISLKTLLINHNKRMVTREEIELISLSYLGFKMRTCMHRLFMNEKCRDLSCSYLQEEATETFVTCKHKHPIRKIYKPAPWAFA